MIIVHHLNSSRSQRILWLLEELNLPYEVKKYERHPKTMLAPAELIKIHPLGKSPVITDGANTVAESGAIIEYLLDKYGNGRLKPVRNSAEEIRYNYWLHYTEGSFMFPLLLSLIFGSLPKQPAPFFVKPILKIISRKFMSSYVSPQINLHLNYLENELQKSTWFAGEEFTAADIQLSFPIEASSVRFGFGEDKPRLKSYLDRIHSRPAYKKALEKGGKFEILR